MSSTETFAQICKDLSRRQDWELLPSGVNVTIGDGRYQMIFLDFFDYRGDEFVRLRSTIGSAVDLGPKRMAHALADNVDLAHGALAIRGQELCMVETLMLEDADPRELEAAIEFLAEQSDHYEHVLFGTDEY
jgi:hypothetical protein